MTGHTSTESMYAITLHQPWASLIALGIKTVETRSWPAPALLVGQTIAIHAGKRVVRQPGENIEQELRARLGEDWHGDLPAGRVVATAILAGMARVAHINPLTGHAVHDLSTETGCAVGLGRTRSDPWGDFSPGRWLWLLAEVKPLPEPVPAVGHQSFWHWDTDGGVWHPCETRTTHQPPWTGNTAVSGIWDNGNRRPIDIDRNRIDDVLDDVRREARCEMMDRATTAQLRYLERLLANANTTWPMVKRRWPEAPAHFDELDKQQAGALIAALRRHGHVPADHRLGGEPPRRQDTD